MTSDYDKKFEILLCETEKIVNKILIAKDDNNNNVYVFKFMFINKKYKLFFLDLFQLLIKLLHI